ncbi:MAG: hypothetical protein QOE61_5539 [Micromonosporaceae bacterium]|jgi:hypothetical protein|nr:hypothetical protein [Micromonosporaceae bacterium]
MEAVVVWVRAGNSAGLVPVMALAEQTGLSRLLEEKVVAGMCAGADSIDDVDVVRSGGMKALFDGVYAPSTVGTLLREFTFGHARELQSVPREHLVASCRSRSADVQTTHPQAVGGSRFTYYIDGQVAVSDVMLGVSAESARACLQSVITD